jgi:hypothetical protein
MCLNYLWFVPLPLLAQAKNRDKQFHAVNEKAQHEWMRGQDSFFLGVEVGIMNCCFFPCSQCVPIMFQTVPKLFLMMIQISPQIYPIWFAQISTLKYINWKGRLESTFVSILWLKVQRGASIGECPMFQMVMVIKALISTQYIQLMSHSYKCKWFTLWKSMQIYIKVWHFF